MNQTSGDSIVETTTFEAAVIAAGSIEVFERVDNPSFSLVTGRDSTGSTVTYVIGSMGDAAVIRR